MNNKIEFKKVLLISNYSISENTPVGITVRSLFNEWPDNKLFEIYRYETENLIKDKKNIFSFKLPVKFLPVDYFIRKAIKKEMVFTNTSKTFQIGNENKDKFSKSIKKFIKYFSESIFISRENSKINEELNKFKPEVLYTIGESLYSLKASLYFSKKYNIPIVVHYMDNWRETIYPNYGIVKILNILFKRTLRNVEKKMINGLVISPKMKEYYSKIDPNTNYKFLLNSVKEPSKIIEPSNIEKNANQEREIVFIYIGGLHLDRWSSLLIIEKCISELKKSGIPSKLLIYTPKTDEVQFSKKFNEKITEFKGYITHEKVNEAYANASILLHVESFNENVMNYTTYSLSTKIPECMATGKPILCYAPVNLAVSEYINEKNVGHSVDNYEELLNISRKLALNSEYRYELGNNGINVVRENHTHQKALEIMLDTL